MRLIVAIIVALMLVQPVYALTNTTCIDDSTLRVNTTTTINVDGNTTEIYVIEDMLCQFGCVDETNACGGSQSSTMSFGIMFVSLAISFGLIFVGFKLDKIDAPIRVLFMFVGMFLMTNTFAMLRRIGVTSGVDANLMSLIDSGLMVIIWTVWIVLAYFMITLLWSALKAMLASRKM